MGLVYLIGCCVDLVLVVGAGDFGVGLDESFNFLAGGESGDGSEGAAVEASGRGGKAKAVGEGPVLFESVEHAGAEGISGTGGVNDLGGGERGIVARRPFGASGDEAVGTVAVNA